jgi:flagellar P-ring protein FlgI
MRFCVALAVLLACSTTPVHAQSRVKDIATLQNVRDNQLIGYGLVVGVQGTGDGMRNSPFTEESVRAMLNNLGIATQTGRTRSKNIAAVIVTANLPPFVKPGSRIDVTVSALGDATSLAGGTLVMSPLKGADGEIYAVAQGQLVMSGLQAQGQAETLTKGVPTAARIPNGAIVERGVDMSFERDTAYTMQLRNPDFSTAVSVADAINAFSKERYGMTAAQEQDSRTISITKPKNIAGARFFAQIENLLVETDTAARVVMDERTGTIVIGEDVRVSKVAISHGTLSVRVTETPVVVQPAPFSKGETAVQPSTLIDADEPGGPVSTLDGIDLQSLVEGLNQLGVKPSDTIAILQAIKSAGALQADLVLQ